MCLAALLKLGILMNQKGYFCSAYRAMKIIIPVAGIGTTDGDPDDGHGLACADRLVGEACRCRCVRCFLRLVLPRGEELRWHPIYCLRGAIPVR